MPGDVTRQVLNLIKDNFGTRAATVNRLLGAANERLDLASKNLARFSTSSKWVLG